VVVDTPRRAVDLALRCCGPLADGSARVARIRDTLHMDEVQVSGPILEQLRGRDIEPIRGPAPLFDAAAS